MIKTANHADSFSLDGRQHGTKNSCDPKYRYFNYINPTFFRWMLWSYQLLLRRFFTQLVHAMPGTIANIHFWGQLRRNNTFVQSIRDWHHNDELSTYSIVNFALGAWHLNTSITSRQHYSQHTVSFSSHWAATCNQLIVLQHFLLKL